MGTENTAMVIEADMPSADDFTPEERAFFESGGQEAPAAPKVSTENADNARPENAEADPDEIEVEDVDDDADADADDLPERDEKGRFVPKSAYLRVKEQAKTTNDKLAQVASELIRMRERQAVLQEMAGKSETVGKSNADQPEVEPDPNEDIFGAYSWVSKRLKALEAELAGKNESLREEVQSMRITSMAQSDYNQFLAKQSDFVDALQHLTRSMDQELEGFGFTDPAERHRRITEEANRVVRERLSEGKSAAEAMWAAALARGYKPKAKEEAAKEQTELDPKATEEIERINKGKKASVSLKGGGNASAALENLTVNRLAEMSEDDFSRTMRQYKAKYGESGWRKLMGG